jgi:hypothetical protein
MLAELLAKRRQNSHIVFETNKEAKTLQIINDLGLNARIETGCVAVPLLEKEQIALINQKLVQSGVEVYQIGKIESDLEEIFFDVIND